MTYGKILEFEKYIDEFEENGEKIKSINELRMINDKITFFKAKIKSESYKKAYDFIEKNGTNKILGLEKELKKIGFTNKEIKKLLPEIEKNNIRSNVDLEKIIGKKRYAEIEDKIKFIE